MDKGNAKIRILGFAGSLRKVRGLTLLKDYVVFDFVEPFPPYS